MWFSRSKPQPEKPFFAWSDPDHSVGVHQFDQEHKHLAALVGRVHHALVQEHDRIQAQALMEALLKATRDHFNREEQAMNEAGYPQREAHASEHLALMQELQGLLRRFHAGTLSALSLPSFLKNWLIPHIQGTDRKYSATLRRQGL